VILWYFVLKHGLGAVLRADNREHVIIWYLVLDIVF